MNRVVVSILFSFLLLSCQSKKKKPEVPATNFFPVPEYIKGEVARLDTSLHTFTKIETVNGRSDTTVIPNKEVRKYAKDFLTLPDIASKEIKDDYEVTHMYDDAQEAFAFTFSTKEDHPVRQENILVSPELNAEGKNDIKSVYVDMWQNKEDTALRKIMLWEAGRRFLITTVKTPPGASEQIHKVQVIWNGFQE